jgi:two-component system sensor histidine kinase CiaH
LTTSIRLASSYLGLIMVLSIGFSIVFYATSYQQLGRQTLPDPNIGGLQLNRSIPNFQNFHNANNQPPTVNSFLRKEIQQGRHALLLRLIYLNGAAFLFGSLLSYILARRTLRPIEQAMEAQVQFVSDASHELRTPLTVIQTTNDVALRNSKLSIRAAKEILRENTQEVIKLKELSDGLLNLAKYDSGSVLLGSVMMQDAVSTAMNQVISLAQRANVSIDDQTPEIRLQAHDAMLSQVLVILFENAIKYSPANTSMHVSGRRKGRYGYIAVQDEGIGIRASDQPHIFRRFYRADSVRNSAGARSGYGLGLSIAKKLLDQQGGTISVQSEQGKGSTFTIRLPLSSKS